MKHAYHLDIEREKKEKKAMEEKEEADKKIQEEKREIEAHVENLQKEKKIVDEAEYSISTAEKQAEQHVCVAQSLLADGYKRLSISVKRRDFKDVYPF